MSLQPKATAVLYTLRTLGGTLGVSVGGSIQLGSLTSNLRSRFADVDNSDSVSVHHLVYPYTCSPSVFVPSPCFEADSECEG